MVGFGLAIGTVITAFLSKGGVAMNVEMTNEEKAMLLELLEGRLSELRVEVRHSRVSGFTDKLKNNEELLRTLIGKIESAS
jgi:hypothetical protein